MFNLCGLAPIQVNLDTFDPVLWCETKLVTVYVRHEGLGELNFVTRLSVSWASRQGSWWPSGRNNNAVINSGWLRLLLTIMTQI